MCEHQTPGCVPSDARIADVGVGISLAMTLLFMAICLGVVAWIFRTGYRLKT